MFVELVVLLGGLAVVLGGGRALVRGAAVLARRLGVAPILIGLTVVAFGTSTPELVVNVAAALRGNSEIGFGNVVGSNIANIGLLLALAAAIAPLAIHRSLVTREIPMMILAGASAVVLAGGGLLGETNSGYDRGDGLMLLLLFVVFLYYTFGEALRQRDPSVPDEFVVPGKYSGVEETRGAVIALMITGGLLLLVIGGEVTVRGAVGVASHLGISDAVIGLTVVAVGTSLPEFATTLIAARRGHGDLAIGNIVGSNIYNLLFIWGLSVTIAPSDLPATGMVDLLVMTGFSMLLFPMVVSQNRLGRFEGVIMLAAYVSYVTWLLVESIG